MVTDGNYMAERYTTTISKDSDFCCSDCNNLDKCTCAQCLCSHDKVVSNGTTYKIPKQK